MNEEKLNSLFAAARNDSAPLMSVGLTDDILRAVRNEPHWRGAPPLSLLDHLNNLFPRVAVASAMIIILCAVADWSLTSAGLTGLGDEAAPMTSQLVFDVDDL